MNLAKFRENCREKIRRTKAQIEMSLDMAVKGNEKYFFKYFSNKRRTNENLHPLVDAGGKIVREDDKNAEVLNVFFASVFDSSTSCAPRTEP